MQIDRKGIITCGKGVHSPKAISPRSGSDPRGRSESDLGCDVSVFQRDAGGQSVPDRGYDRSFDEHSGTYGNSFKDFEEWPKDKPMDAQAQAEFFIGMCFTDTLVRLHKNGIITDEELDSISWMARKGLLIAAAATVNYILNKKKGETTDGSGST